MRMLKKSEIAAKFNRSLVAVQFWIEQGLFPNAKLNKSGLVPYWEVPESDLKDFKPPERGRRKKIIQGAKLA
jgi:hypothetical protein